jgi:predicted transcriptional regulator
MRNLPPPAADACDKLAAAMRLLTCLLLALSIASPVRAEEAQKPNKIERGANKAAKGTERTVKRVGNWAERTGNRAGKAVERAADKTEHWVKKKLE